MKKSKDNIITPIEVTKPVELIENSEVEVPHRKGILKVKCSCGNVANVSDEIIEDGLSWMMIIGNEHYLTLHCEDCGTTMTMYIEEITGDKENELPQESNKE
jgi:predicted nucleic-acid-binding Zn-ribbon protein